AQNPRQSAYYEKLAQVTTWQADVDARFVTLAAVEALATPSTEQRQVLAHGRQKLVGPSRRVLDDSARAALRGNLGGALHEMWRVIAPGVQVATGVDAAKLGFSRSDRVALKKLGSTYEPLATAL